MYQFDKAQSRLNSSCTKWDRYKSRYQIEEDVIPLWVADMDFECLPEVSEAIRKRAAHRYMVIQILQRNCMTLSYNGKNDSMMWR